MEKISLCYIAQGSCFRAIHSFQSLGFAIKEKETEFIVKDAPKEYIKTVGELEVELFVIDQTKDQRTSDFFNEIATNVTSKEVPLSALINDVVRMATGEYVCVIPTGAFVQRDWLINLIYYYKNIDNCGVLGIPSKINFLEFVPVPSKDAETLVSVLIGKDEHICGIFFTERQKFYLVGALDESVFISGEELNQFCTRAQRIGLQNFYIPNDNCVYIRHDSRNEEEKILASDNLKKTLIEMKKSKNYYIPL